MTKNELYKTVLQLTETYFKKHNVLEEANVSQGQTVTYNGKQATVIQIYQTPPTNTAQQEIKLPTDQAKYPVYVIKYNDGTDSMSVLSKDSANNLIPA